LGSITSSATRDGGSGGSSTAAQERTSVPSETCTTTSLPAWLGIVHSRRPAAPAAAAPRGIAVGGTGVAECPGVGTSAFGGASCSSGAPWVPDMMALGPRGSVALGPCFCLPLRPPSGPGGRDWCQHSTAQHQHSHSCVCRLQAGCVHGCVRGASQQPAGGRGCGAAGASASYYQLQL
jgi:hypothetical protein